MNKTKQLNELYATLNKKMADYVIMSTKRYGATDDEVEQLYEMIFSKCTTEQEAVELLLKIVDDLQQKDAIQSVSQP